MSRGYPRNCGKKNPKKEAKRPTCDCAPNGDEYKGTGRSVNKVDIYEMLNRYRDCFLRFGEA
jgi:single-stranded DNA-specific DHH superfamily exonuclease